MNYNELKDFAHHAQAMISSGAVEDRLRHYLSSKLPSIFPDSPWWIQAHMDGTEAHVRFSAGHRNREGFVDAVVGKTAIEYEKNLTQQVIFDEGYHQVKEYCAALHNIGIPAEEILGVLSDTVRWYGYSVTIVGDVEDGHLYGPDNIELTQTATVDLSRETDEEFRRFGAFVSQFLDREQSRLLNASTLVTDFGMDSSFYSQNISVFRNTITRAMSEKPDYAALIQQVWQNFIAYLGVSDYGRFSVETYINEFYLVTVAKIICVNVMAGEPVISDTNEIKKILNGEYFTRQNVFSLVDYDYFGWLNNSPYVEQIVGSVVELQHRLVAYDFSRVGETDIFGRLLAQLANKEHRLMLGQEFTPHWVAQDIVEYNMDLLTGNSPRIVDIIDVRGLSFKRYLDIAKLTGCKVAVITDNDTDYRKNCVDKYSDYASNPNIKIFYEADDAKRTFEFILYGDNPALCDTLFDSPALGYMLSNKTEAAYALLSQDDQIVVPDYMKKGIKWIRE